MACTLAESLNDPFHRRLRQLCCLHCRFDCCRVERTSSRAGVAPAEVQRLFTAHCFANNRMLFPVCRPLAKRVPQPVCAPQTCQLLIFLTATRCVCTCSSPKSSHS